MQKSGVVSARRSLQLVKPNVSSFGVYDKKITIEMQSYFNNLLQPDKFQPT
jgi:hypothetical protein